MESESNEVKSEVKPQMFGFMNKFYQIPFIKRNLLPIIVLYLGVFCLVAGYIIHEQVNGYYCTVAYNEWGDKHIFKVPLDNFSNEMDRISNLPNIFELNMTDKGNLPVEELG